MWSNEREVAGNLCELQSTCWWWFMIDEKLTWKMLSNGIFSPSVDLCFLILTLRKR